MSLRLGLRAGLLLGLLRTIWIAFEHLLGVRTEHLEWVEPSYGTFLIVGTPLVWVMLWRSTAYSQSSPPNRTETLGAGYAALSLDASTSPLLCSTPNGSTPNSSMPSLLGT